MNNYIHIYIKMKYIKIKDLVFEGWKHKICLYNIKYCNNIYLKNLI